MTFDVSVNGKPWKVAVDGGDQAGRYIVTVKGKRREMDAAWIDAETLSLIDVPSGVSREVWLTQRAEAVEVTIGGTRFRAVVEKSEKRGQTPFLKSSQKTGSDPVSGRVIAPMPGRVVRVLVAVGDTVTAGQAVVVVEAMKMENELRSSKDGVVAQLFAVEGAAIETGAVLVVVECP